MWTIIRFLAVATFLLSSAHGQNNAPHRITTTTASSADYPRVVESEQGRVTLHMPQIETWERYQALTAWTAVEATATDSDKVWLGSVKVSGKTDIDFDQRVVVISEITVLEQKIANDETPPEAIKLLAREAISLKPRSVPLDVVVRALPEDFRAPNLRPGPATEIRAEPPRIFVATAPAALMIINGDPVKAPIKNSTVEFVVNTNWDLFWDNKKERWYVLNGKVWQTTDSLVSARWKTTRRLPKGIKTLPEDDNWTEVRKALPPPRTSKNPPRILVSFEPAELILIDGKPKLDTIVVAGLSWVTNTHSDLFFHQGEYYYLVSGRWFHSIGLANSWTAVDSLPKNFSHIPTGHAKSHVLASIPGTDDARAAAIEAQIPRTATIRTDAVPAINVSYAGAPQFADIEGTALKRAVNTSYQVIQLGAQYYLCYNAVWFSANQPTGPWGVATEVPAEIYTIPASDPAHNVTYVYNYPASTTSTSNSNSTVVYAYTPGYYGVYYSTGSVVFGTGFYYPPYYYYNPWGYPAYWWHPRAYGHGAWYNPSTGTYGRALSAYGPYGGTTAAAAYNPRSGTYARGWSTWDNDEVIRGGNAYNPRTGTWGSGNMYYDFDDKEGWSERFVQRDDRWVYSETDYDGNRARSEYSTARGISGTSNRTREDGVISGSGAVQYGDRSATTQSRIDRDGSSLAVGGEQGGSVDLSRQRGERGTDVDITRSDGTGLSATTTRRQRGNTTTFVTGQGGQGASLHTNRGRTTLGRGAEGDLYASRNGEVYRRNAGGNWSQYQNGGWQQRDRSSTRSTNRDYSNLNRQYHARQNGNRNYSQYRSQLGNVNRGQLRGRAGGRRR